MLLAAAKNNPLLNKVTHYKSVKKSFSSVFLIGSYNSKRHYSHLIGRHFGCEVRYVLLKGHYGKLSSRRKHHINIRNVVWYFRRAIRLCFMECFTVFPWPAYQTNLTSWSVLRMQLLLWKTHLTLLTGSE